MDDEIRTLVVRFRCRTCGNVTTGRESRTGNPNIDNVVMFPRLHRVAGDVCLGTWEHAEFVDVDDETGEVVGVSQ